MILSYLVQNSKRVILIPMILVNYLAVKLLKFGFAYIGARLLNAEIVDSTELMTERFGIVVFLIQFFFDQTVNVLNFMQGSFVDHVFFIHDMQ